MTFFIRNNGQVRSYHTVVEFTDPDLMQKIEAMFSGHEFGFVSHRGQAIVEVTHGQANWQTDALNGLLRSRNNWMKEGF